jgi:hypothetical protein
MIVVLVLLVFHHVKEPGPYACLKPCIFMQWPLAAFWDRVLQESFTSFFYSIIMKIVF